MEASICILVFIFIHVSSSYELSIWVCCFLCYIELVCHGWHTMRFIIKKNSIKYIYFDTPVSSFKIWYEVSFLTHFFDSYKSGKTTHEIWEWNNKIEMNKLKYMSLKLDIVTNIKFRSTKTWIYHHDLYISISFRTWINALINFINYCLLITPALNKKMIT